MLAGRLGAEVVACGGDLRRLGVVAHVHVRRGDARHGEVDAELPHRRQVGLDGPFGDREASVKRLEAVPFQKLPVRGRQIVGVDVDFSHGSPFGKIE